MIAVTLRNDLTPGNDLSRGNVKLWAMLSNDVVDHISRNVGQAEIPPTVAVCKLSVVDAHQVEDSRMQVMHMHPLVDALPAKFISSTITHTTFHAATRQ